MGRRHRAPAPDGATEERTGRGPRALLLPVVLGAALGVLQMLVVHRSLVDDAYIGLAYARNLATSLHWGLLSDVTSNTATSPFFVMALAVPTAVLGRPVVALGVLVVIASAVVGAALGATAGRAGLPRWTAPLALVLLAVNPLLLSSTGLETHVLLALLAALVWSGVARRPVVFGLLAGALVLTRVDAVLYVVVLALGLAGVRRRLHVAVPAALVVTVPWYLFSWVQLGSFVPDTLVVKTTQGSWGPWTFANGIEHYYLFYPGAVVVSAAVPVLGLLVALALLALSLARRVAWAEAAPWLLLATAAAAVYGAYSVLGVPPYHWYYGSTTGALCMVVAGGAGVLGRGVARRAGARDRGPASSALAPVAVGTAVALATLSTVPVLAGGVPWDEAAIASNWAQPGQYLAVGRSLEEELPGVRLDAPGEIGALAFACDCIVDLFADPARLRPLVDQRISGSGPLARWFFELNYRWAAEDPRPVRTDGALVYRSGPPPEDGPPAWRVSSTKRGTGNLTVELRR